MSKVYLLLSFILSSTAFLHGMEDDNPSYVQKIKPYFIGHNDATIQMHHFTKGIKESVIRTACKHRETGEFSFFVRIANPNKETVQGFDPKTICSSMKNYFENIINNYQKKNNL